MEKRIFPIEGMMCAMCASTVEKTLNEAKGVQSATVNYATGSATVSFNPHQTTVMELQKAVKEAGYELILQKENQQEENWRIAQRKNTARLQLIGAALFGLPVVIIAMFYNFPYNGFVQAILSLVCLTVFGRKFFIGAYKQLRNASANMDTLVSISTSTAWLYSFSVLLFPKFWEQISTGVHLYFESAVMIICFVLLGKLLEENAKSKTQTAVQNLLALSPMLAHLKQGDKYIDVPLSQVKVGDILLVKTGEQIPADGVLCSGNAFVNESLLTGEPLPIQKQIGSKLYAGTTLQMGTAELKTQQVAEHTLLAAIIQAVRTAQGTKPAIAHLVDKISAVFVPVVLLIACISAILWYAFHPTAGIAYGVQAFITVLVIACPCALGLATPTALVVGIGKGASAGILIKDAQALEQGEHITDIVLDKTGTLTTGQPCVVAQQWASSTELLPLLVGLESLSQHPLAKAIVNHFQGVIPLTISNFKEEAGKGISGTYASKQYRVCSYQNIGFATPQWADSFVQKYSESTLIALVESNYLLHCVIALEDTLKPSALPSIVQLKYMNIAVHLLSGDSNLSVQKVAQAVGITHYQSQVLPQQKAHYIQQLQNKGKKVAMVGDGINDSPALAQSNISIAMGEGAAVAIEVAGITILGENLQKIPQALVLSHKTMQTIRRNLFWAFIYNLVSLPIAAGALYPTFGILLNPMWAACAMALSSLSVVSSSLLLKNTKLQL